MAHTTITISAEVTRTPELLNWLNDHKREPRRFTVLKNSKVSAERLSELKRIAERHDKEYESTRDRRGESRFFETHRLDGKRALGLGRTDRRVSKRRPSARQASRAMRDYHNMLDTLAS